MTGAQLGDRQNRNAQAMSRIDIEGTFNLRDVGGLPVAGGGGVRPGLLYRGDALDALTDAGVVTLRKLHLRTIIDLREPIERRGSSPLNSCVDYEQIPIYRGRFEFNEYEDIAQLYFAVVEVAGKEIAEAIARLAQPKALPALVHCTAGKDRTGLVVGLLLAALDVTDAAIAANFALTEANFTGAAQARARERAVRAGLSAQRFAVMAGSPPQLMLDVLQYVRATSGTVAGYLAEHGLTADALADLRRSLIKAAA